MNRKGSKKKTKPGSSEQYNQELLQKVKELKDLIKNIRRQNNKIRPDAEKPIQYSQPPENLTTITFPASKVEESEFSYSANHPFKIGLRGLLDNKFGDIILTISHPFIITDDSGRIIFWNKGAEKMYGFSSKEVVSHFLEKVIIAESDQYILRKRLNDFGKKNRNGELYKIYELMSQKSNGSLFPIELSLSSIQSENNNYFLILVRDISGKSRLKHIIDNVVDILIRLIELRDPYTAGHQKKVTKLAMAIARGKNLSPRKIEALRIASLLHDVGKINIPMEILNKPVKLSTSEFDLIKNHSYAGYQILKEVGFPRRVREIVFQHHERLNGSGYPRGLQGKEILPFLTKYEFKWCATDEDILYKCRKINHKKELYKPYFIECQGKRIVIIFRDKTISDLIGFNYGKMKTSAAIKDLIAKIKYIQDSLDSPGILPIILDGENPWEFYPEWGISFLRELYHSLTEEKNIFLTTIKEAINNLPAERLDTISTGSWINGDFKVWIGEEEDNLSWDYLRKVRNDFENFSAEEKRKVKKIMFAAEGSDWNWWYGTKPLTTTNIEFDFIYRTHLMSIYSLLNKEVPAYLLESIIKKEEETIITLEPKWIIQPIIDGKCTNYFEWHSAGNLKGEAGNGMMVIHEPIIDFIKFGFDLEKIFFLIKFAKTAEIFKNFKIKINLKNKDSNFSLLFSCQDREFKLEEPLDFPVDWKFLEVLEMGIPFLRAGFKKGEKIFFNILYIFMEKPISKIPGRGMCGFTLPDEEYLSKNWIA